MFHSYKYKIPKLFLFEPFFCFDRHFEFSSGMPLYISSQTPVPGSPFPIPHSPFPIPHSPFPVPRSPFPVPRSPFPVPRSPFPVLVTSLKKAFRFFKIFARDFDSQSDRKSTFIYAIPPTILIVVVIMSSLFENNWLPRLTHQQ